MANLFSYTKVKQRNSAVRCRIRPADLDVCALRPAAVRAHSVQEDHCEEDHCESRDFLLVNKNLSLSQFPAPESKTQKTARCRVVSEHPCSRGNLLYIGVVLSKSPPEIAYRE